MGEGKREGHAKTPWHVFDCEPYQETKVFKSGRTVVGGEGSDQAVAYCDYCTPQFAEANARLIVTAVNERSALLKCEEALREMVEAAKAGHIDSEELPGDPDSGIAPYKWHEEWSHYARSALSLLDEARHGK